MLRRCSPWLKQTANPPRKRLPLSSNPLARWSRNLPFWSAVKPHLTDLCVGLEGCRSAFNATNSIRTCMFFGTASPPTFTSIHSWREIEHVQSRDDDDDSMTNNTGDSVGTGTITRSTWDHIALFGEDAFHTNSIRARAPIVALENFTPRSENVLRRRFPHNCRLVVGHENNGVSAKYLCDPVEGEACGDGCFTSSSSLISTCADSVVYIPQYGTISSLNVVTSLGVALFYAFLDQHFPNSRSINDSQTSPGGQEEYLKLKAALSSFQAQFENALPSDGELTVSPKALDDPNANKSPRLDVRPLHPVYFKQDSGSIVNAHEAYRSALLAYSNARRPDGQRTRFGISLLYENEYDQRNFGGLIRNANAFLVDKVCYLGRRKFNVVGAVGSYHYTPPVYLGSTYSEDSEIPEVPKEEAIEDNLACLEAYEGDAAHLKAWSCQLRSDVERTCGGPLRFWLLDCGHGSMYAEDYKTMQNTTAEIRDGARSSIESLQWYMSRVSQEGFVISLCDSEEALRESSGDGIVLLVPQEGKLPHISLLMQCERILTVMPHAEKGCLHAAPGLPSQVASGIALQRLSVVFHPCLKDL